MKLLRSVKCADNINKLCKSITNQGEKKINPQTKQELIDKLSQMSLLEILDYALDVADQLSAAIHNVDVLLEKNG